MEKKLISVSNLIKTGWQLCLKNYKQFILPIAVLLPAYLLLYLLDLFIFPGQEMISLLVMALAIFINLWISILLIELINKIHKNQNININELFQSSMKKIASYFWVLILISLIIMLGFILLIIPGIIFAIWYSFAEYIVVLEDIKGVKSLKDSKDLVRGRWGAAFWRLVLPSLLVYVFGGLIALVLTLIFSLGNIDFSALDQNLMFNAIVSLIFIILSPLFTAYGVILYNNLKDTKKVIIQ
ncbi:hypothetical protein JW977_02535 [Candidatus Falkowbacteria bacterium]|nr:hypothetical protein [Candidatus Falkowbacteria bacterium]